MYFTCRRQWQPTPVLLPGKSHGWRSLVAQSMGSRRVGHDWSDLAAAAADRLLTGYRASQVVLVVKNSAANAGDLRDAGLIPGWGRPPGKENGNPIRYSCLENPRDRGAWSATVRGVAESDTTEGIACMHVFYHIFFFLKPDLSWVLQSNVAVSCMGGHQWLISNFLSMYTGYKNTLL